MEELGDHAPGLRPLEGEAHEAAPRVVRPLGMAVEQLEVLGGDREHRGVDVRDAAGAGDASHRRHVDAGVAPPQQVFAGPRVEREAQDGDRHRRPGLGRRGQAAPRRARAAAAEDEDGGARAARTTSAAVISENTPASASTRPTQAEEATPMARARNAASSFASAARSSRRSRASQRAPGARNRTSAHNTAGPAGTMFRVSEPATARTASITASACASDISG